MANILGIICVASLSLLTASGQRLKLDRQNLPIDELELAAQFSGSNAKSFESFRLPNTSYPTQYSLFLDTNIHLSDFKYTGSVQIRLTILEDTKQLVLHSARNEISSVQLLNNNQLEVALASFYKDTDKEFLVINTKETLPAGNNYQLGIEFSGELRTDLAGFYRSSYRAEDGTVKHIAVTQFEASYARSAFPCFDEPGIRATFAISISCGFEYKATSNMPIAAVTIQPNQKKLTRFQVTPRMPTYLVAFMVTDFISKRKVLNEPTRLTMEIFARSTAADELDLGLEKGAEAIRAIEKYVDLAYHLPKLDQVAVPDFAFVAMENWGLVKYEEPYILVDEQKSSNRQKLDVILTITHELVHQFFGNLVTPKWWTDLFLNEGFATMYEYYISAQLEPSIRLKELFPIEALQLALYADSLPLSRPLSYYVENNVMSLFDAISYQKGGSVLRMMHYALGERTFQKGVRRYLAANKDSSVDPNDLFEALQSAAREDAVISLSTTMEAIMSPWVYQSGYPLVTVQRVLGSNELVFRQEHFSGSNADLRTWWIPISYRLSSLVTRDETETVFWMPAGASQLSVELNIPDGAYLLINPHQTGFYRVNYDEELWERLIGQLSGDFSAIPAVSRAQLIDDSFKLARAGKLNIDTSFKVMSYLARELDYVPWYTAFASDNLGYINRALVIDGASYQAFQNFVRSITNNVVQTIGFIAKEDEPHEHQSLRAMSIEWSCRMGSVICRNDAHSIMAAELAGTQRIPTYLKHSIYCGGLMDASEQELLTVFRAYQASTDLSERSMYISALGCSENSRLLSDYLMVTLNDDQEVQLMTGEWLKILQSVYSRSNVGYESFEAWLRTYSQTVMSVLGGRQEFHAILADITLRKNNFNNFEELIDMLKLFQSQT